MTDDFADRFEPSRYAGDEPVCIAGAGRTWDVPEGLFGRLQNLARAYELHLLPTIDIYGTTRLNAKQCVTLADELTFVRGVVEDRLLRPHLDELITIATVCARSPPAVELVIEGP